MPKMSLIQGKGGAIQGQTIQAGKGGIPQGATIVKLVTTQAGAGGKTAYITTQAGGQKLVNLSSLQAAQAAAGGTTLLRTLPPNMVSVAKAQGTSALSGAGTSQSGQKQTIVIQAPKQMAAGQKILTSLPKGMGGASSSPQQIIMRSLPQGATTLDASG